MASCTTQRQALLSAVAALPTADDGSWSVPAPILKATSTSEADAKRHVLSFSAWAQGAVRQLPEASEHEATDFSDYYKIVMSRVQLVYAKATQPAGELRFPACRFQTQLRRRPQVVKDGAARELGVFDSGAGPEMVGSYGGSSAAFRAALQAVGERRFRAATLRRLIAARGPPAASIEESLAPVNEEWVRLLSGSRLFELLDDGVGFSASGGVQVRVELQGGQAVVLAQGPWFRVTFAETPILQCMAQFMTDSVQTEGDHGAARWCRDALMNFAVAAHSVQERVHAPGLGSVSFFAGRRAPHADFHLLQHLYLQQLWPAFATSSLFAGRVLPRCRLVGTSAHEGPMALMALEAPLDARLPLSSVLWTVLFWACTGNRTVLPDAFGSATFKHMLLELGLLPDVAMARQDSGRLARFAAIFPETRRMASEIEEFADIEEALRCGYRYFGAGGFFGEKRRGLAEFSIAAKITTALCPAADGTLRVGHAGKLGDFSEGSWADYSEEKHGGTARAKFIVPAEVDRDEMFARLLGYARAGDALHDAATAAAAAGGGAAPGTLLVRADAEALAARLREVGGAEAMGGYARIRDALTTYAERVDAAAAALPAQPQAAAASR